MLGLLATAFSFIKPSFRWRFRMKIAGLVIWRTQSLWSNFIIICCWNQYVTVTAWNGLVYFYSVLFNKQDWRKNISVFWDSLADTVFVRFAQMARSYIYGQGLSLCTDGWWVTNPITCHMYQSVLDVYWSIRMTGILIRSLADSFQFVFFVLWLRSSLVGTTPTVMSEPKLRVSVIPTSRFLQTMPVENSTSSWLLIGDQQNRFLMSYSTIKCSQKRNNPLPGQRQLTCSFFFGEELLIALI